MPLLAALVAQLTFSPTLPPLHRVFSTYVSVNVDAGSIYNNFDFASPPLRALTAHLVSAAPTQLRIGGGAADTVFFTGVGGARGNCSGLGLPGIDICVSGESWDGIAAFSASTGVGLVFDLNGAYGRRSGADPWNSTNAAALLAHAADAASRGLAAPVGWQLGNEPEDWYKRSPPLNVSGATLAADFRMLKSLLHATPGLPQGSQVLGPDGCCEGRYALMAEFAAHAGGALDGVTVHAYPLPYAPACNLTHYLDKNLMLGIVVAAEAWRALAAPLLDAGVPLIQGETATSAHGGCPGLSNTFVAGFTYMLELGALGEVRVCVCISSLVRVSCPHARSLLPSHPHPLQLGVSQVNRQDLAGWSSEGGPSYYALLGKPGWSNGPISPHPDYFTALLWKQLVGTAVLASALASGDPSVSATVDAHVWCGTGGHPVVTYFNANPAAVELQLPAGVPASPRTEFLLTSGAAGYDPTALTGDRIFLNGNLLSADASGALSPPFPFPGRAVPSGGLVLPPLSYGFLVLEGAATPACA